VTLAVLSACDTGSGKIKNGEGVFGLRRAFRIAGVQTLITSLWGVEDKDTKDWMEAFYEAIFSKKLQPAEAVREASLEVLRKLRNKKKTTHPFYWGGFVASGNWN
jgi:CHAT domain-containing protein